MKMLPTFFKQNKLLNMIFLVSAVLFYFLVMMVVINIKQSHLEVKAANVFKGMNVYKITDQLFDQKEKDFFMNVKNYNILDAFADKMAEQPGMVFYQAVWQPIGIYGFKGNETFGDYYEFGKSVPIQNFHGKEYTSIKSMQLNQNAIEINQLQLDSGRLFNSNEYIFSGENIPILLGADYQGVYRVGDRIDLNYYQQDFVGTVVGLFQPSQKIMTKSRPEVILDRYVILPSLNFNTQPTSLIETTSDVPIFFRALLLSRVNGTIISDLDPIEVRKIGKDVAVQTGFNSFDIIGADSLAINTLVNMIESNRDVLLAISIGLFIITLIVLIMTVFLKIKKNVSTYTVLLISGADLTNIWRMIGTQLAITSLIGSFVPFLFLLILTSSSYLILINYLVLVFLVSLLKLWLAAIFARNMLARMDIVQKLKG